ncbi:hypothetical protein KSC_109790 [Ktedonobacter sp. SOSP1-52]|nr:hypothetical protein KSC_109790 [Ktedonobacter sp. SOSP1-52]
MRDHETEASQRHYSNIPEQIQENNNGPAQSSSLSLNRLTNKTHMD